VPDITFAPNSRGNEVRAAPNPKRTKPKAVHYQDEIQEVGEGGIGRGGRKDDSDLVSDSEESDSDSDGPALAPEPTVTPVQQPRGSMLVCEKKRIELKRRNKNEISYIFHFLLYFINIIYILYFILFFTLILYLLLLFIYFIIATNTTSVRHTVPGLQYAKNRS
jgi:hypothetical protein